MMKKAKDKTEHRCVNSFDVNIIDDKKRLVPIDVIKTYLVEQIKQGYSDPVAVYITASTDPFFYDHLDWVIGETCNILPDVQVIVVSPGLAPSYPKEFINIMVTKGCHVQLVEHKKSKSSVVDANIKQWQEAGIPIIPSSKLSKSIVSIIIPVYNKQDVLSKCLQSVVKQTQKDIQIICIDDGSTDGSLAILRKWEKKDDRILVIEQKQNRGPDITRNIARPYICGKYTFFCDADDEMNTKLCVKAVKAIKKDDADVVFFQAKYGTMVTSPYDENLRYIHPKERIQLITNGIATWQKMWKSDFLLSNNIKFYGGIDQTINIYDDHLQTWTGTILANRIAVLNECLYRYDCTLANTLQRQEHRRWDDMVVTIQQIQTMLIEKGYYDMYMPFYIEYLLTALLWTKQTNKQTNLTNLTKDAIHNRNGSVQGRKSMAR